jgi:hypothetical protein
MEGEFLPAYVETVRIINVNIDSWSVDCVSMLGNKRFFDIQVSSPYFHYMNGEGFYCMPEVGALAWICKSSTGRFGAPFIMGYQAPFDEEHGSFKSNRLDLNPGDMMMRTRDENFVILRRGGVVQIGATPICQTMYVPINNIIRHFCEKFEINAFGGELLWETFRREEAADEDKLTKFSLNIKDSADKEGHVAKLSIGSHGDGEPVKLQLTMFPDSEKDAEFVADLMIDEEGNVTWDTRASWTLLVAKAYSVETEEEDISFTSAAKFLVQSTDNAELKTDGEGLFHSAKKMVIKSDEKIVLNTSKVYLQSPTAAEPLVLGTQFKLFMSELLLAIGAFVCAAPGSPVAAAPAVGAMSSRLDSLLSQTVKTT